MGKKDEKAKKVFRIAVLIIIIIILILFHFIRIGEIENDKFVPTGYVDIFDIEFGTEQGNDNKHPETNKPSDKNDEETNSDEVNKPEQKPNDNEGNMPEENPETPENTDKPEIPEKPEFPQEPDEPIEPETPVEPEDPEKKYGIIFKADENGSYIYMKNLEIFKNAAYEYTNKIAPGVSNTYNFIVHNSTGVNLNYKMEMYEETEYKVNLKYRLKKNGEYIIGDDSLWVTAEELNTKLCKIELDGSDNYSLDWKWFHDDENDTLAGKNMTSEYKLYMKVYMELVGD